MWAVISPKMGDFSCPHFGNEIMFFVFLQAEKWRQKSRTTRDSQTGGILVHSSQVPV